MSLPLESSDREERVVELQERLLRLGYCRSLLESKLAAASQAGAHEPVKKLQRVLQGSGLTWISWLKLLPNDQEELRAIARCVVDVLSDTDEAAQRQIVEMALGQFGVHFWFVVEHLDPIVPEGVAPMISDLAVDVMEGWRRSNVAQDDAVSGARRAVFARDFLDIFGDSGIIFAASILLRLPEGDPLRDVETLRSMLLEHAQKAREAGEFEEYCSSAEILLLRGLLEETEALDVVKNLMELGNSPDVDESAPEQDLRIRSVGAVAAWHTLRAIAERDAANPDGAARHREDAIEAFQKARALGASDQFLLIQALNLDEEQQQKEAVELLSAIGADEVVAEMEATMRVKLRDYDRAIELLEKVVPRHEERYLLALDERDVRSAGEKYTAHALNLAFCYARKELWSEALDMLDRTRSPRLRHAMKLRESPAGTELLKLEAMRTSNLRGVPNAGIPGFDEHKDPLGARLSAAERALELYRNKRPDLGAGRLTPPTVAQVGATLGPEEAIVSLGLGDDELMTIVICHGDVEQPSDGYLLEKIRDQKFEILFAMWNVLSSRPRGFPEGKRLDPVSTIGEFLEIVDNTIGKRIATFLSKHPVRRVTIIPHLNLHTVPFWALPSLRHLDVRTSPSVAQWYQARKRVAALGQRVTSVGNPTLDLGLAAAEAQSVQTLLAGRGFTTDVLLGDGAKEGDIRDSVRDSSLLHFAGHGRARSMEPMLTALLTHPDEKWDWPLCGDPLAILVARVREWHEVSERVRYVDLDEGRLIEARDAYQELDQRRLEYSARGTLWGKYGHDNLVQLAELWTVSDIVIEDAFAKCAVAYLSACESGRSSYRVEMDEDVGLPSALQIAGVDTIVGALWPVGEVPSLLFSRLFYGRLAVQPNGIFDLYTLVARCRNDLASLSKMRAIDMLRETAERATGKVVRASLEYAIEEIEQGCDPPFANPWFWAPFFSQGVEHVQLGCESESEAQFAEDSRVAGR